MTFLLLNPNVLSVARIPKIYLLAYNISLYFITLFTDQQQDKRVSQRNGCEEGVFQLPRQGNKLLLGT